MLMPDLTIWLPTYLNNNVKQCAFINPNHLQNILPVNIVLCSSSIFQLTSIIKMYTFESLLLKHYKISPNLRFYGTTTARSNYITVKVILLSWLFGRNTCKVVPWRYNKTRINCNGLLNLSNELEKKKQSYFHMQW